MLQQRESLRRHIIDSGLLYIVEPSTLPLVEQALLDKMGSWIQIDSNSITLWYVIGLPVKYTA